MSFSSVHDIFNAPDSDITIISSDGVAFKLHRKYLDYATGVFPGAEVIDNKDESIELEVPARILTLVFKFIYPNRHPKLKEEDFETVLTVAEAVAKYQVFSAMNTCEARLIDFVPKCTHDQATSTLVFAIKHDFPDLINAVAPHLARAPIMPILEKLPPYDVLPWIRYREKWNAVFARASSKLKSRRVNSRGNCFSCIYNLIGRIAELERLDSLSTLTASLKAGNYDYPFDVSPSTCPENHVGSYREEALKLCREGIAEIPPFTEFMSKAGN